MGIKICISKLVIPIILLIGCSSNYFDEFASKDTPEAKIFAAKMALNDRDYSDAISFLESLDASYLSKRENQVLYASAYSGRCGLEFISLVEALGATPATTFLAMIMGAFPESTAPTVASDSDCVSAENILKAIGDQDVRTGDENLLMAFNSFAKIGTFLNARADANDDGVVDGGFDHCTSLSDDEVNETITGLALVISSLGAVGGSYVDIGDISAFCALSPEMTAACAKTDASTITAPERLTLRHIVGSVEYGMGSCGTFAACVIGGCP